MNAIINRNEGEPIAEQLQQQGQVKDYKALHDSLVTELEALLRQDDEGAADDKDEHADRIAALSSALRNLNNWAEMQEDEAVPAHPDESQTNR